MKTIGNNIRRSYRCAVTGINGEVVSSKEVHFTAGSTLLSLKKITEAGIVAGICVLLAGLVDFILRLISRLKDKS